MMIVSQDKYAHRVLEPRMVIGVLAFVLTNGVYGQIVFDDKCTTPIMHLAYVRCARSLPSQRMMKNPENIFSILRSIQTFVLRCMRRAVGY